MLDGEHPMKLDNSNQGCIKMRAQNLLKAVSSLSLVLVGVSLATPPTHNEMGATFRVISKGQTNTIEITLKPKTFFDTVRAEAASGAGSLTPPCSFTTVVVGGSYSCEVNVSHKAGEASLTLNVVGEKTLDREKPRLVEISHFTLANAAYVAPAPAHNTHLNKATPSLTLTPAPAQGTTK
jgi:hypothetical protein